MKTKIETYYIEGEREFDKEFPLPGLTVTGVSGDYGKTAELDARIQAIDFWRSDNEGWGNGGRHGLGNIEITTLFLYSHC